MRLKYEFLFFFISREPDQWSPEFIDFVSQCLVKNPKERATAEFLLTHEFIGENTTYIHYCTTCAVKSNNLNIDTSKFKSIFSYFND